jgi:peptidoglycan/xylan/chitin deacetylase (PgdA/CDA1 family)
MSWGEVREMADAGMLIGAHTVTHQILAGASPEDVRHELAASRAAIEANVGRDCWCFSYPNGEAADFREVDRRLLQACGFECAFTQVPGFVDRRADRYALPRLAVPSTSNFRLFLTRVTGLLPLLTARSDTRQWARAS